jgi:hypothetical protein
MLTGYSKRLGFILKWLLQNKTKTQLFGVSRLCIQVLVLLVISPVVIICNAAPPHCCANPHSEASVVSPLLPFCLHIGENTLTGK